MSSRYASVASSKVIQSWFFYPWGCLSENSSTIIPDMTTSWCSIMRTLWTHASVIDGDLALQILKNGSCSSLCKRTVHYTVNSQPFTLIWIYFYPTGSCFSFLLVPVLQTICKCASWVIILVAALGALQWTYWCVRSGWVPIRAVYDFQPVNQFNFDLLSPGWSGCESMICWCGVGEEDDYKIEWEILRAI
jgi:hypothetical protein